MDWTNCYIEEEASQRQQYFWVSVFHFLTKTCIDEHGLKGEKVIREAVRRFGSERSIRKRQIANAKGLPPDLVTMFGIKDILSDTRFTQPVTPAAHERVNVKEPELSITKVYTCPNADIWLQLEGKTAPGYADIGSIYCEEVHHRLYGDFDPAIQVNLNEILTKGDECCNFRVHLRKANQEPFELPPYEEKNWEYYGDDPVQSIHSMFCLHFCHYARMIKDELGEETLRKGLRAWANARGERLQELNRRKNQPNDVNILIEQGDMFHDPRYNMEAVKCDKDAASITVGRCILCELLKDHDSQDLAQIYCEEVYQGICDSYNPAIKVELEQRIACGADCCKLHFKK